MGARGFAAALAVATLAPALGPVPARAQALPGEWRTARWGMTVEAVLAEFPGEAARLEPPERLADGNVVAAGIEKFVVGATAFRVRFVFDPGGKLALVSLRTDPKTYAGPEVFEATKKALVTGLGPFFEETRDDAFIDMRQATWRSERGRVDVKFIPGTVVILHAAPSQRPAAAVPSGPQAHGPDTAPAGRAASAR